MIKTIGIIGAGQLALMLIQSAQKFGIECICIDPDCNAPAFKYTDRKVIANFNDLAKIKEFADLVDVIIYEFENVDINILKEIDESKLYQGTKILKLSQNRILEKDFAKENDIQTVKYMEVTNMEQLKKASEEIGYPGILKTQELGYDGKGQLSINNEDDLLKAKEMLKVKCIYEQKINFAYEISAIACNSKAGGFDVFDIFQNKHVNGILHQTILDVDSIDKEISLKAKTIIKNLMCKNNIYGILCIEFFIKDNEIYFNEMAPRPHNSGHITLDSTNVSQFEQMIRCACNYALIKSHVVKPMQMINILGQHMTVAQKLLKESTQAKVYLYGKSEIKTDRKMGHINIYGNEIKLITDILKELENDK